MSSGRLRALLTVVAAAYCAVNIYGVWGNPEYQWDFHMSYTAARAYAQGLDPYDNGALSAVAGREVKLPFVYPPHVLYLLRPFTALDFTLASKLYFSLKAMATLALFLCWRRILGQQADCGLFPFAVLAFTSSLFMDLDSGNFAIFEQALLWGGFLCWLRGRDVAFSTLVVLASSFKLVLAPFLLLPLLAQDRRRWVAPAIAGILFVAALAATQAEWPDLFAKFLRNVGALDNASERGSINPATLPMLRDLVDHYYWMRETQPIEIMVSILYLGICAVALFAAARARAGLLSLEQNERDRRLLFLACFVYALVVPRFKIYSYILLLAPTYHLLRTSRGLRARGDLPLALLLALPTAGLQIPAYEFMQRLILDYAPLLAAYGMFALSCVEATEAPKTVDEGRLG